MNSRKIFALAILTCLLLWTPATSAWAKSDAESLQTALIEAGKTAARSVVQIRVTRKNEQPYKEVPAQPMMALTRGGAYGYNQRPYGPCTGVVIDGEGHVLTSNFNVEGAVEKITVTLADGKRYDAKLLGRSEVLDVALLKIQGEPETPHYIEMKKPEEETRVGTYVLVVSRTENVRRHSQTFGIVSAVKRLSPSVEALQIDAKVNYGNSGAPVIDIEGNFLGLVGYIRPSTSRVAYPFGLSSGIGFANTAQKILAVLDDLKAGKVIKAPEVAFLGVAPDPAYTRNDGVLVRQVIDGSAAKDAGLEPGDLIIEFDGRPVRTFRDLANAIQSKKVGDKIRFKIKRGEQTKVLKATLKARPAGQ